MTTPETTDPLAGAAIERLTPYLPAVGGTDGPGPDPAVRSLYDLVAARLCALDEAEALAEFVRQPRNNSLVRRLLATAVRDDPAYAAELAAAVAAVAPGGPPTEVPADTGPSTPPATVRRLSRRVLLVGLAVLVVVVAAVCLVARNILGDLDDSGGLTSQSSCAEFRQAPKEDRVGALRALALARDLPQLDSPLGLTAVTEACATHPERRLDEIIANIGR